jgi:hypothetical protein
MNDDIPYDDDLARTGKAARVIGWIFFVLSIFFFIPSVCGDDMCSALFSVSFVVLASFWIFYLIAKLRSERWRSKLARYYFKPYIMGMTMWMLLFLVLLIASLIAP